MKLTKSEIKPAPSEPMRPSPPLLDSPATRVRRDEAPKRSEARPALDLTIVAPVYNEVDNLDSLVRRIDETFDGRLAWELILVDDGSHDGSTEKIRALALRDSRVRGLFHRRNRGQTSAIAAGIRAARARLLATLDADLQNDPMDLISLLDELGDADAIVGYRVGRKDNWVRRASSRVANAIRNGLTGDSIRDTGCSLKVFRTDAIRFIPLFEGMHRFLPTLLRMHGFEVREHPVSHRPRLHGESKYNVRNRAFRALKDLFAVRWMRKRVIPRLDGDTGDQDRPR